MKEKPELHLLVVPKSFWEPFGEVQTSNFNFILRLDGGKNGVFGRNFASHLLPALPERRPSGQISFPHLPIPLVAA